MSRFKHFLRTWLDECMLNSEKLICLIKVRVNFRDYVTAHTPIYWISALTSFTLNQDNFGI